MTDVDVLVIDAEHGVPVAGRVELTDLRSGPGVRRALVCPKCRAGRYILFARSGVLACGGCHRLRTRHQRERTMADWYRRGGREEDRLLRLLAPMASHTPAKVEMARQLVLDIVSSDRARLLGLQQELATLAACAGSLR
jgi:hypothetical protein